MTGVSGAQIPLRTLVPAVTIAYAAFALMGMLLAIIGGMKSPMWGASGLALTVVVIWGWRAAIGVFIGAALTCAVAGDTLWSTLLIATGNALEPIVGAWALWLAPGFDPRIRTVRDYAWLLAAAALMSTLVATAAGVSAGLLKGVLTPTSLPAAFFGWWSGNAVGIMIVAPVMLMRLLDAPRPTGRPLEASLLFWLTLATATVTLGMVDLPILDIGPEDWMLVLVLWAAIRFGRHYVAVLLLITFLMAAYFASRGEGPFYAENPQHWLASLFAYQALLTLVGMSVATAIRERRSAEEKSQNAHALLRSVIDSVPDLIFYKDTQCRYLGCNRAFESFLGAPAADIVGRTAADFVSAPLATRTLSRDMKTMSAQEPVRSEEWVTYPDGRRALMETLRTRYCSESGAVLGVIGISRDVTERKREQQERDMLLEAVEASANEYYLYDADTLRVLAANDRASQNTGYDRSELYQLTAYDLLGGISAAEFDRLLRPLRDGAEKRLMLVTGHRRKDGSNYAVDVTMQSYAKNGARFLIEIALDVSEQQSIRSALANTERQFQRLAENATDVVW